MKPAQKQPRAATAQTPGPLKGASQAVAAVRAALTTAAAADVNLRIIGEPGSGKLHCARLIHSLSVGGRNAEPLSVIDCRSSSDINLGALLPARAAGKAAPAKVTSAVRTAPGTLILHHAQALDETHHAQLIDALHAGSHRKPALPRVILTIDVDAAWPDMASREQARFLHQLPPLALQLPPLRHRQNDAVELARWFLSKAAGTAAHSLRSLSKPAEKVIANYHWPGNVRQLQDVIDHLWQQPFKPAVSAKDLRDALAATSHVAAILPGSAHGRTSQRGISVATAFADVPPLIRNAPRTLAQIEREAIEAAIDDCGGSLPKAATQLGVSPSTIYRKRESWQKPQ